MSTVQCFSDQGIMLVPKPACAQEFGAEGIPGGGVGAACGAHAFAAGVEEADCCPQLAGVAGAADGCAAPKLFPVAAPLLGKLFG